ncbi:lipoprotein [Streptomyces sp. NPDC085946]|uniref:lipoprotein n=1 Tax=Streptomyces sp. NPDC085946 TaxID=3365744 RepID=UPI0037CFB030
MERYWAVGAVVSGLVLVGCSPEQEATGRAASPEAAASQPVASPGKGEPLGGAGTPCALPVSFETAQDWTAEEVDTSDPEFVLKQGSVTLVCEVDAKPAGHVGFLRVWTGTGKGGTARSALESFVDAERDAGEKRYRETEAGGAPAAEVTYTVDGEWTDGPKDERAFAVMTPRGPVVVHLGGLDSAEHRAMLPAYEQAKRTLVLNS